MKKIGTNVGLNMDFSLYLKHIMDGASRIEMSRSFQSFNDEGITDLEYISVRLGKVLKSLLFRKLYGVVSLTVWGNSSLRYIGKSPFLFLYIRISFWIVLRSDRETQPISSSNLLIETERVNPVTTLAALY